MFILFVVVFIYLFVVVVVFKARCQLSHEEENTHAHTQRETDRQTHTHIQRVREKKTHAVETDTVKLRRGALSRCSQLQRPHNTVRSRASDARRQRYCGRAANNDDVGSDAAECATKTRRDETKRRHDRLDNTTDTSTHAAKAKAKATEPATEHANGSCAETETERRCCRCRAALSRLNEMRAK